MGSPLYSKLHPPIRQFANGRGDEVAFAFFFLIFRLGQPIVAAQLLRMEPGDGETEDIERCSEQPQEAARPIVSRG